MQPLSLSKIQPKQENKQKNINAGHYCNQKQQQK